MAVEIILKFADDTKIAQPIRCEEDRRKLQAALDRLGRPVGNGLQYSKVQNYACRPLKPRT